MTQYNTNLSHPHKSSMQVFVVIGMRWSVKSGSLFHKVSQGFPSSKQVFQVQPDYQGPASRSGGDDREGTLFYNPREVAHIASPSISLLRTSYRASANLKGIWGVRSQANHLSSVPSLPDQQRAWIWWARSSPCHTIFHDTFISALPS